MLEQNKLLCTKSISTVQFTGTTTPSTRSCSIRKAISQLFTIFRLTFLPWIKYRILRTISPHFVGFPMTNTLILWNFFPAGNSVRISLQLQFIIKSYPCCWEKPVLCFALAGSKKKRIVTNTLALTAKNWSDFCMVLHQISSYKIELAKQKIYMEANNSIQDNAK